MVRKRGSGIVRIETKQRARIGPRRGGHHRATVPGGLKLAIVRTLQAAGHRLTGRQVVEALGVRGMVYAPAGVRRILREMQESGEVDHRLNVGLHQGYGLVELP